MPRDHTRQHRETLFAEAVAVIDATEFEQLTIDEVARRIATSRRQLQRVFEEVGGMSFREFLARSRAERAARLLEQGVAVAEVARRTGYGHASHFARAFKRHHGVTPSQYARRGSDGGPTASGVVAVPRQADERGVVHGTTVQVDRTAPLAQPVMQRHAEIGMAPIITRNGTVVLRGEYARQPQF